MIDICALVPASEKFRASTRAENVIVSVFDVLTGRVCYNNPSGSKKDGEVVPEGEGGDVQT